MCVSLENTLKPICGFLDCHLTRASRLIHTLASISKVAYATVDTRLVDLSSHADNNDQHNVRIFCKLTVLTQCFPNRNMEKLTSRFAIRLSI